MLKYAQETFTAHSGTIESSITRGEEQLAKTAESLRDACLLPRKSRLLGLWLTCFLCSWFLYYMCSSSGLSWEWKAELFIVRFGKTEMQSRLSNQSVRFPTPVVCFTGSPNHWLCWNGVDLLQKTQLPTPCLSWFDYIREEIPVKCLTKPLGEIYSNRETVSVRLPTFWFPFGFS